MVFVLDEPEAVHELDLGNLAGAMGVEVVLNIGLGSYNHKIRLAMPCPDSTSSQLQSWKPAHRPILASPKSKARLRALHPPKVSVSQY